MVKMHCAACKRHSAVINSKSEKTVLSAVLSAGQGASVEELNLGYKFYTLPVLCAIERGSSLG